MNEQQVNEHRANERANEHRANEHRGNEHRNGPVRSAAARDAILEATARLFQSEGYDHLTIEGIAKEAGVGKQTIYRWWPTRGALIADCLSDGRLFSVDFAVPDTGDLVADVEQWLDTVIPILDAPGGGALLRSLVAAAAEDSAVGDHLSESLGVERHLSERLTAGIRDGQLAPGAPVDELGHAILGTIIVQVLSRQDDATDRLRQLVRFMLRSGSPQNGPLSPTDAK